MNRHFESDPFPGRPRILFIGSPENSHTHSWIDLLADAAFNVRLFSMTDGGLPPDEWPVRTYVMTYDDKRLNPANRARLYPANRLARAAKRHAARLVGGRDTEEMASRWLAKIIKEWRPDIVHALGIRQGGEFYLKTRARYGLDTIGKFIIQTRGGSDLTVPHLDPERRAKLIHVLGSCDQLICDNEVDLQIAADMELREEQRANIAPVPGTGGIDVEQLREQWHRSPSERRAIVWPKAYDSAWGKMMPTFEALKLCWGRIQPCEVHLLSMNEETFMWFWTLPDEIRQACRTYQRISRSEVLALMPKARVMVATALTDGVPNSLYEAMAAGAFPIVSPLDTIQSVVQSEENVLFARNVYPHEIAEALTRAMTDDHLVHDAAERNLALVRRIANRDIIRSRVIEYYQSLVA